MNFAAFVRAAGLCLSLLLCACMAPPGAEQVATAAAVPLANTPWRLTQLGAELVSAGQPDITLRLEPENTRVSGFSGCNRYFGGYALQGDALRFDQLGATKMACLEDSRMQLEQRFLAMLADVAGWRLRDRSLELLAADHSLLATFVAMPAR